MSGALLPANMCMQACTIQLLVHDMRCVIDDEHLSPVKARRVLKEMERESARLIRQTRGLMALINH